MLEKSVNANDGYSGGESAEERAGVAAQLVTLPTSLFGFSFAE
jgi:hypothetical protein